MDFKTKIGLASAALAALFFVAAPSPARAKLTEPPGQQIDDDPSQFGSGGWLGVSVAEVNAETVKQLKLPGESGALISEVAENTPAAKAGLKKNDVVLEYQGQKIEDVAEFRRLVRETPPGREAQMEVWRDGHTEKLSAQIGQVPAAEGSNEPYGAAPPPSPNFRFAPGFGPQGPRGNLGPYGRPAAAPIVGIAAEDLSGQLGAYFGAPGGEGVLVTEVREGSPAQKAGLKAGDVILKLNDEPAHNVEELRGRLMEHRDAKSVTLDILRKGMEMAVTVEPQQPLPINPGGPRRIPL